MSIINKTSSVQAYRLLCYQRPLHPELFDIHSRKSLQHTDHETECWLTPGGHMIRFQAGSRVATEAIVDHEHPMPQTGLLDSVPCIGERELDLQAEPGLRYVASLQIETLSENLYNATFNELREFAAENHAMTVSWDGPDGSANLSIVDIQRFKREVHAQAYHLVGAAGFVLRSQSIFELS